jgi:hypothetical protein
MLALVLIESISAYHSLRRTFGRTPDDVDDERFIAARTGRTHLRRRP